MKRSFRVATVFTGAAACAAAFAPTANAAQVGPNGTTRITPDAKAGTCEPGLIGASSLHLYYSPKQDHPDPACVYLSDGYVAIGNGKAKFSSYCGGGYSGYLYIDGSPHRFTKGDHHLYGQDVSGVYIDGNPGGSACTYSPPFHPK
jgi:hypothetical protein